MPVKKWLIGLMRKRKNIIGNSVNIAVKDGLGEDGIIGLMRKRKNLREKCVKNGLIGQMSKMKKEKGKGVKNTLI